MTKENILFVIVGLLAGFMVGFFFANSVNQGSMVAVQAGGAGATQASAANLPSGHPPVTGGSATGSGPVPEVQAAIENARQNPTDFDAQMKAAELYYQIQRFEGAIEFLKKANELQPDNYDVMVNLGNAYFDANKFEDAEKAYSKALEKKSNDLDVRTDLGLTFIFREPSNPDRAIQEFKRVLDADPTHVQALQNLTVAYTKKSDKASATATLARLEQADSGNTAISKLKEEIQKISTKQ